MPQMVSSNQLIILLLVITLSVLFTAFVLSRLKILPSLDNVNTLRYTHLDGMRGLAALLVFLNHLPLMFINLGIPNKNFYIIVTSQIDALGAFGVQVFFGITGYLFTEKILKSKKEINWGDFYTNRLKRLVPLYFFAVTLAVILAFIFSQTHSVDKNSFLDILKTYGFGFLVMNPLFDFNISFHFLGTVWTLPYEWRFYVLMPVFFWLIKGNGPLKTIALSLVVIALIDLTSSSQAIWPFFLGGFFAAVLREKLPALSLKEQRIFILLALMAFIVPIFNTTSNYGLQAWILRTIGFILMVIAEPRWLKTLTLRYLGEISYSFYLLGIIVAYCFFSLLGHFKNLENVHFVSFVYLEAIVAVFVIIACSFTFRFIEYPFLRRKHIDTDVKSSLPVTAVAA